MLKVNGINELAEMIEANNRVGKAKKEIKKDNVKRMAAEGVDPEIAKIMVNVFDEYDI